MQRAEILEALNNATDEELAYAVHVIVALRAEAAERIACAAARDANNRAQTNWEASRRIASRLKGNVEISERDVVPQLDPPDR